MFFHTQEPFFFNKMYSFSFINWKSIFHTKIYILEIVFLQLKKFEELYIK